MLALFLRFLLVAKFINQVLVLKAAIRAAVTEKFNRSGRSTVILRKANS